MINPNSAGSPQHVRLTDAREAAPTAISRIQAIDGLRGVAISLVVALHFGVAADFPNRSGIALTRSLERVLYVGWSGVDLFFVLSGFLITSILLASRDEPLYFRRFYVRRALRILPLYYILLVLVFFVAPYVIQPAALRALDQSTSGQVWLWTYTLNIGLVLGQIQSMGLLAHFWTLAIEEQYYLFWPWVVKWISPRGLVLLCGGVVVGALGLRIGWISLGYSWEGAYHFTFTRFDALSAGGLVAVLAARASTRNKLISIAPYLLTICTALLAVIFALVPHFYPNEPVVVTIGHTLLAAASAALVGLAIRERAPRWMYNRLLRTLGKYSYGIYVWHWPLQRVLVTWYPEHATQNPIAGAWTATVFLLVGFGGSFVLGWCSYHVIERPFLRLKGRFEYPQASRKLTGR